MFLLQIESSEGGARAKGNLTLLFYLANLLYAYNMGFCFKRKSVKLSKCSKFWPFRRFYQFPLTLQMWHNEAPVSMCCMYCAGFLTAF